MQARMRQMYLFAVVALGLVVVLAGTTLAQSSNPTNIGTWKLNVAKSTATTGAGSKSVTFTVVAADAGVKVTVDSVAADDTVQHWEFSGNYDGKDNPITGNSPYGDVVASTRVDANTTRSIYKKGGTVTVTQTAVVSSDGKTTTITGAGTDALGQTVNTVRVYDKQ
jgi:hypothetical protein